MSDVSNIYNSSELFARNACMATSQKSNIYKSLEVYWLSIVGGNLKDKDSRSVSRFPDYTRVIISAIYQDCF